MSCPFRTGWASISSAQSHLQSCTAEEVRRASDSSFHSQNVYCSSETYTGYNLLCLKSPPRCSRACHDLAWVWPHRFLQLNCAVDLTSAHIGEHPNTSSKRQAEATCAVVGAGDRQLVHPSHFNVTGQVDQDVAASIPTFESVPIAFTAAASPCFVQKQWCGRLWPTHFAGVSQSTYERRGCDTVDGTASKGKVKQSSTDVSGVLLAFPTFKLLHWCIVAGNSPQAGRCFSGFLQQAAHLMWRLACCTFVWVSCRQSGEKAPDAPAYTGISRGKAVQILVQCSCSL